LKNPYQKNTPSYSVWQNGYDLAAQGVKKKCPYSQDTWKEIWNKGWEAGLSEQKTSLKKLRK
jgi:ribosome modulation factor